MDDAATLIPTRYTQEQHHIDPSVFDRRAIAICRQLHEAGYEAYLVGGCLRDTLLQQPPKDFDIATNARPEEIAALFRNCRLIGRRFRLAHLHYGRDIIEVATFRASADEQVKTDADGHVLEDNHYGTMEEDVLRRDFIINSLYYDVQTGVLIDYLDALADIRARQIRLIGTPSARYIEDPVRMLRAARFAAKLSMPLEAQTQQAIASCRQELRAVPAARLFDEVQKLFMSGYGEKSYEILRSFELFAMLFPDVDRIFSYKNKAFADYADRLIRSALQSTDQRIAHDQPVTVAFLFAAFLWPVYQLQYRGLLKTGMNWHSAMQESVDLVLIAAAERVSIPLRLRGMIREIWTLQARFELTGNSQKKIRGLLTHPRFRAAYDFLVIRQKAGEALAQSIAWWTAMQTEQQQYLEQPPVKNTKPRKSRNARRKS